MSGEPVRMKQISPESLARARAALKSMTARTRFLPPDPPTLLDAAYYEGLAWLDDLDAPAEAEDDAEKA